MGNFIPVAEPSITQREINYVSSAIKSGWVSSLGYYIDKFENEFAKYIGVKYALTVSNGTAALHLALVSLGIKTGDEVIIPDLTFISTANAIAYTGAKPVFADIEKETWCIDYKSIERLINSKTKAIIPVHLYGHPANMAEINKIARKYKLLIIEDAAEAHGAEYNKVKVGGLGICGIFSFYGNKIITTGEGGMITTNNFNFYKKAKLLRDHAMSKKRRYWHTEIGYNYRMTNLQGALGLAQLERINGFISKKIQIFQWYKEALSRVTGIELNPEKIWAKSVYWMVCLILDKKSKLSRNRLMLELKKRGIDSRPFFYPISKMPIYNNEIINPVAYDISARGINLPSGVSLNKGDVRWIAATIKKILI